MLPRFSQVPAEGQSAWSGRSRKAGNFKINDPQTIEVLHKTNRSLTLKLWHNHHRRRQQQQKQRTPGPEHSRLRLGAYISPTSDSTNTHLSRRANRKSRRRDDRCKARHGASVPQGREKTIGRPEALCSSSFDAFWDSSESEMKTLLHSTESVSFNLSLSSALAARAFHRRLPERLSCRYLMRVAAGKYHISTSLGLPHEVAFFLSRLCALRMKPLVLVCLRVFRRKGCFLR